MIILGHRLFVHVLLTPNINNAGFKNKKSHILEIAALELSSREGMQTLVNIFPHKVRQSPCGNASFQSQAQEGFLFDSVSLCNM